MSTNEVHIWIWNLDLFSNRFVRLQNTILSALSRCPPHQRAPPLKEAVNRIPCTGTATPRSTTGCSQHFFHLLTLHRWPGWRGGGLANTRATRRGTTVSSTLRWAKRFRRLREYEVDATIAEEQSNDVCTAANKTRTDARPTRWEPDIVVDKT